MGSIINRDGRWRAQVRRKGFPQKCKTFDTKAQAREWVARAEADIADGSVSASIGDTTIGDVIRAYRAMRDRARPISDSSNEHYMLKALDAGLGAKLLRSVTPDDLVSYATQRREDGAGPYTINMDVSKLGTVIRYGCASLRIVPPDIVGAARPLLAHLRLIGGGGKRERRPTEDELIRVFAHLRETYGAIYEDAARFAALTAMRRGEICDILKDGLDPVKRVVPVMRKHPRKGKVLEVVPLLGDAWELANVKRGDDPRVFPIHPQTLSKYFTETCKALGIVDLHFHDLRHEGTSRLFEDGYSIEQVALVTGHKSWNMLKRYTQLKPEDLTRQAAQSRQGGQRQPGSRPNASRRQGTSSPGKSRR